MTTSTDPARFPGALLVDHSDVPGELTLREWRRQRHQTARAAQAAARARRRALLIAIFLRRSQP